MQWNWQLPHWPQFQWNPDKLARCETLFVENAGIAIGSSKHLSDEDRQTVSIELLNRDALCTSEIEGEYLNRDSVLTSIMRQLGLQAPRFSTKPSEAGVAEMMVNLYRHTNVPLTEKMLCDWHDMIMNGRRDIICKGMYRAHTDTMQIVSGPDYARKVHFEAPPSERVPAEMAAFLEWFSATEKSLGAVARAGIAHLWFESIHPFEDGNGRIGRAIAEKTLSEGLSAPVLTVLSKVLLKHRKDYYAALAQASKRLDIMDWLLWFGCRIIEAQQNTAAYVDFIIQKTKLLDRMRDQLNARQEKAIMRIFREGPEGFAGGLSAKNYMRITDAAVPTATRDLHDLVEKNVLTRTGERKATRYFLAIQSVSIKTVTLDDIT